jgi:ABC-2 type transport system ATP-binding protein
LSQQPAGLEFQAASKWYGQVSALTDITVGFTPGVTGLVGGNGAGKTTMMKLAAGLLRPSYGIVLLSGQPPTSASARQDLGYCPDIDKYYEDQSGHTFVTWMLRLSGFGRRAAVQRTEELMEQLDMSGAMHRRIAGYSKGMRQRIKLAVALGHEPRVLLLDEPMTGLDPVGRQEILDLVRRLSSEGVVVVVSSHVLHELQSVADRVVLIHRGRMLAEGTVADIRNQIYDRPRRILLATAKPRDLAARLVANESIVDVAINDRGVEIATQGGHGIAEFITELGAAGHVSEVLPLDDSLESVFGYLVK